MPTKPQGPFRIFAPGVVIDANGAAVIDPAEVLACLGRKDTPENRNLVINSIKEEMVRRVPNAKLFIRTPGLSAWAKEI